jgi:site-specific DNA recombinase
LLLRPTHDAIRQLRFPSKTSRPRISSSAVLLTTKTFVRYNADAFAAKSTELRDRAARLKLQGEVLDRGHDENADIAVKAFGLSQSLMSKWLTADYEAKRQILEIVCLNWRLDDVTFCPTMRKPFDVLAERLLSKKSRGDRIRTCDLLNPIQCEWYPVLIHQV